MYPKVSNLYNHLSKSGLNLLPTKFLTFSNNKYLGNSLLLFAVFNNLSTSNNNPLLVPSLIPACFPAQDKSWQGNE